ncbi:MAG: S1 RNA-binding domain-containing protein [Candidatus Aenigmarchaeota archaeon]|nr:S1 RNA-binding domain-containing protein [Candidatus Aenigmarchaeota archaeon]
MRNPGFPERGELVVCEISKINPNSAFANLLEYDRSGMIHVSEVAKRWVRNIREFVKQNQLVVCKVIRVDDSYISLSIKRVNKNQADRRLQEYKREKNAEKFLEIVGKQLGLDLDKTYDAVGNQLLEQFGSMHRTFEIALKNPELLTEKGIDKKWAAALIDIAKKNFVQKTYEVKAELTLTCHAPGGIDMIKGTLQTVAGKGLQVRYISAPKYNVVGRGENIREVKELVEGACEEAVRSIEGAGGEGSFTLAGKNEQ